jgi:dihydrofolate synthase/folylpolyglutamate synthase
MRALGNPHKKLKCIHIAGTNGKGATASFIASILFERGVKTGLFTSPHILKFNERIRIDGKCISDSYIKTFLKDNNKIIEQIKPSFFEVNTALAFKYFADKKVNAAVIETGLGGKLDSTNIINPLLTIITQIGIDHTEYLGKTLEKIAKEKAGIVKPGVDLIVSDNHRKLRKIFNSQRTFFLDDYLEYKILKANISSSEFRVRIKKNFPGLENLEGEFSIPMPGEYQVKNALAAVVSAWKFLIKSKGASPLALKNVKRGLKNVKINSGYRGRFEYVKHAGKNYILDISHNPDGIEAVKNTAKKILRRFKKIVVVFAMMKEKDYKTAVDKLFNFAHYIIFTKPDYERALPPETLFEYAARPSKISVAKNVKEALIEANKKAGGNDIIMITGSFFLVSEVIRELKLQKGFV